MTFDVVCCDLDGVVWGSQKGMMIPPGLGFVCFSPRGWELVKESKLPKFYWNLAKARTALEAGDTPFTPAISLVLAARAAMLLLAAEVEAQCRERQASDDRGPAVDEHDLAVRLQLAEPL